MMATAGAAMAQVTEPWEDCWSDFETLLTSCCTLPVGNTRETCFEGAAIGLTNCLEGVEDDDKPDNCASTFLGHLNGCIDSGSPGCISTEACNDGALAFFDWCSTVVVEDGPAILPELQWDGEELPAVVYGQTYEFSISVRSPLVTGITFLLVHSSPSGRYSMMKIGEAELIANFWDTIYAWEFIADTATWPILDDERVILLARTELGDTHGPIDWAKLDVVGIPGDFNRDGLLDALDFIDYQTAWQAGEMRADMNGDGELDVADFAEFQLIFDVQ